MTSFVQLNPLFIINEHVKLLNMIGKKILDAAIQQFNLQAKIELTNLEYEGKVDGEVVDAILELKPEGRRLLAEVKNWVAHKDIGAVIHQLQSLPQGHDRILVADYVNPPMAEKLKKQNVNYMDAAGNVFLDLPGTYVQIEGRKPDRDQNFDKPGKAFTATGLKVVYALLTKPELLNATYREVAEQANVALGAIGEILKDLKQQDFLAGGRRSTKREFVDKRALIDKWVEEYPKLRQKINLGAFYANKPNWWKDLDLTKHGALLGGELAAAKTTNQLKPKIATIYLDEAQRDTFLKDHRLQKAGGENTLTAPNVQLFAKFWGDQDHETELTDPLLTYADLLATGEVRNREVANEIANTYLYD